MSWNPFGRKNEKDTGNDHHSVATEITPTDTRHSPTRNPITGEGMETDDSYTTSGDMNGSSMAYGNTQENKGQVHNDYRYSHKEHPGHQQHTAGYGRGQPHAHAEDSYTAAGSIYGSGTSYGYTQGSHNGDLNSHQGDPGYKLHMTGYGLGQAQTQGHIFRTAQASKQMVYEVYGNCITMLEELESRELRHHGIEALPRSDIHLPSQQQHDDDTVQRKLETQLLLFQSQMDSCDKEIKDEVRQELKENTLKWNSMRETRKIPNGVTDKYAGKLYEVLEKGKTQHPKEFYEQPSIDEKGIKKALQGIVEGQHRRAEMDEDFKKNPDKKAKGPILRSDAGTSKGAKRLARNNPELAPAVDRHIKPSLK